MSNFITAQNWRYATKKFDSTRKVSDEDINILKEAIRLSTSSYGLQAYQIILVENPDIRAKLQTASWGQSQVIDASHLFVFANYTKISTDDIDEYINNIATTRELPIETISGYSEFMKSAISKKSTDEINTWNQKQTYLALGNLMAAAAEIKVDVTPMEGFIPEQYNQILDLNKLNLNACLVAAVGYRSSEDATQHLKKVRKSNEDLFITI
jgi:nitroreductase